MDSVLLYSLLILVGLAGSAYFSAVEISIISANRLKVHQFSKNGRSGATLALDLLGDQEQVLATSLIGLNLFNFATAAFVTSLVQSWLGLGWKTTVVSTTVGTLLLLVFAEIVPKVYGKERADTFLVANARPVLATQQIFLPVTAVFRFYIALLLKPLQGTKRQPFATREDLKLIVRDVKGETGHGRKERKMLRSLLGFGDTTAREVMVPMTEVVSIEKSSSVSVLRATAKRAGFTRIPVHERRIDKIIGVVNVYDVLFDLEPKDSLETYVRPALLVPETKRIDRLLLDLQRGRQTMAVVVSEFGSCVGIVTLEDIVEEIVGEMAEEDEIGVRKIREITPGSFIVDALTDIDDVNDELGLALPKGRFDTLAGLLLHHFGRIPGDGERYKVDGVEIEVVDAYEFGVRSVKLVLPDGRRRVDDEG